MTRALRLLTAFLLFVSLGLAGGMQMAFADPIVHAATVDCPHAAAAGGTQSGAQHPSGTAMPMPSCCYALPSIGLATARFSLALPLAQTSPRPASERLPLGASPGPEQPPPRA